MKNIIKSAIAASLAASSLSAAVIEVTAPITTPTVWTSANEYVLTDIIFVRDTTLTIEAGTIVRGEPRSTSVSTDPGALVITRSAQIVANGTPNAPIIFTTAALDSDGDGEYSDESFDYGTAIDYDAELLGGATFIDADPAGSPLGAGDGYNDATAGDTTHLAEEYRGLWGGLIVLGNAPTNIADISNDKLVGTTKQPRADLDDAGEGFIEGLDPLITGNNDGVYGGSCPNDSSGSISYVSIRHGGTNIAPDNEINGLTMGGVGYGTRIEYVEVYCNDDDGFEWFGGTAASRFLISLYNNDDSFDGDEGYQGLGQFWFSLQLDDGSNGDHGAELDGTDGEFSSIDVESINGTAQGTGDQGAGWPAACPTVYNATFVNVPAGDESFKFDDSFGGFFYNSIFVADANKSEFINVTADAQLRVDANDTEYVLSSIFYNGNGSAAYSDYAALDTILGLNSNILNPAANPLNAASSTFVRTGVDPRATPAAAGSVSLAPVSFVFFTTAGYPGAFNPGETSYWSDGWSVFSENVDNK